MTRHLLAIHIGPMQSFIAAARRTRDLWFGSWLMSELSKATAKAIDDIDGAELIFPTPTKSGDLSPDSDFNVANRIVAILPEGQKPSDVADKEAHRAMKERLEELGKQALNDVEKHLGGNYAQALAQILDLPEFYWVAVPLPSNDHYQEARATADALLSARKNTRTFAPVGDWASSRPKSSLDGLRESVIPERFYAGYRVSDEEKEKKRQKMYSSFRARAAEQLSGVDLLKRLGAVTNTENRFPSTSHMAATPFLQGLQDPSEELQALWKTYYKALEPTIKDDEQVSRALFGNHPLLGDADGSLLYESRLIEYYEKEIPSEVKDALQAFYKHQDVSPPLTYYAILVGDGDSMGKTLDKLTTPDAHRDFSKTLAGFASEARKIVEDHGGAAIFTGGDDVMALLPLHTAVECAKELADTFTQKMKQALEGKNVPVPTFSAGIAIFHHIEPLEDGLALARRAEKIAKAVDGKNALAVALDKRGGAERIAVGKWDALDQNLLTLQRFYRATPGLPKGFAYQLRDAYLELGGTSSQITALTQILQKEAERILKRRGLNDEMQGEVAKMLDVVDHQTYTLEMFSHELVIANLLAQAQEQANPSTKNTEANE